MDGEETIDGDYFNGVRDRLELLTSNKESQEDYLCRENRRRKKRLQKLAKRKIDDSVFRM
jgi:hypothetical protein